MGQTKTKSKSTIITYQGWKIKQKKDQYDMDVFLCYTKEEWEYGSGLRQAEWEAGTMQEAKDFIDSY
ncbi:hypothetical protein [Paenibacillus sp. Mc5Re-14]|uniref:hypothetical protein n=1 Tax=Paenibacillus sp. Mc5Re-14 TaxID=1030529 RepID=UPI000AD867C0|nr:hypothetical protein [Paenibacillus sp. Mc5Re-14]